jgi:histidinol phosphatase-like PHP family hydrolase
MITIDHDLHVHTYLSSCCEDKKNQTPKKILVLAEEMGLKTIGFSDHIWTNTKLTPNDWYRSQSEQQIGRLRHDLMSISSSVRILIGCEADTVSPGKFSITQEFAESLDYVGLSCSHFHMKGFVQQPVDYHPCSIGKHLITFFVSAAKSGLATVIVHPFKPFGYETQYDNAIAALSDAELFDTFSVAADHDTAIEITTSFLPPVKEKGSSAIPIWSIETPVRILSLAKDAGCKFCFGSDAHSPDVMKKLGKLEVFSRLLNLSEEDMAPITRNEV